MTERSIEDVSAPFVFDAAAHRYYLGGVRLPNVTAVLQNAGLIDYGFLSVEDRARSMERGRRVHQATHDDDNHSLAEESISGDLLGYVEAWRNFRRDYGFVPRLIEHRVCNRQYGYAGTLDRVGSVRDGSEFLVDLKTGAAPAAVAIQLSAYSACLAHPRTRLRRCVELHEDSTYKVIPYQTSDYQRDFNEFLAALETFRTKEEVCIPR
jgi:hypothetical protein